MTKHWNDPGSDSSGAVPAYSSSADQLAHRAEAKRLTDKTILDACRDSAADHIAGVTWRRPTSAAEALASPTIIATLRSQGVDITTPAGLAAIDEALARGGL